ncbi:MAG: phosphoglucosamine mutase [Polyangia bacterium]|jgi:phosphoglucosamine mutase
MQSANKTPDRKLFGTDGIRGIANVPPMTIETAMRLGRAVARLYHRPGHRGRIIIGKDTRLSGYMFEQAMAAGICSMGADVMLCGPLPTPGIAFLTSSMRADAGVVISASHNPYYDNGIKIFAADGFKLPDATEAKLEELMSDGEDMQPLPAPDDIGRAQRIDDARGRYIVFLKNSFPRRLSLDGLKIVVDCAHGAAYRVAPNVLTELGATVTSLAVSPDGKNINEQSGALHPEAMCKAVVEQGAHVGIALDGDADRVIFADERGKIIDGDAIMALCARRLLSRGELRKNTLVATVMSNLGLERAIADMGGKLLRTAVGDRYVVEAMRQHDLNLGGEQSGHLVFLDHMTTGDGIIAALQVLATMLEENQPLSTLASVMKSYPQVLLSVKVARRLPLGELGTVQSLITGIEQQLGSDGRVLVRYSGTEPKARVMIEGPDAALIDRFAHDIASELVRACS